jgi:tetratricopeptide (TPR) repeat protein
MPYLKNATVDAAVSLGSEETWCAWRSTRPARTKPRRYVLREGGAVLAQGETDISPDRPFSLDVPLDHAPDGDALSAALLDAEGRELVEYHRLPMYFENRQPPKPHKSAPKPSELDSVEALFLNGLHIEQYRNPTFEAEAYYREGLRRDPSDSRCNLTMGRLEMRRGRFEQAKEHLLRCLTTLTDRNPNPYDGEAYYQLGAPCARWATRTARCPPCGRRPGNYAQSGLRPARERGAGGRRGALQTAAACAEKALLTNRYSLKTRLLLCALCRRLGRKAEAEALCRKPARWTRWITARPTSCTCSRAMKRTWRRCGRRCAGAARSC